jgi:colicin import membrane protein
MHATANDNWNRGLAPELVRCTVRFTQLPGGDVTDDVEFMDCPYDAQARESVVRALLKTPMPYSGFESVFQRKVILTFCYPEEACIP